MNTEKKTLPPPSERAMSNHDSQRNIAYLNSFGWVGGKHELRPKIATYIPSDIKQYIEPFGGAGWVLFYKERWARYEIYNDLNSDLTNLFTMIKHHSEALVKEMEFMIPSEETFYTLKSEFKPLTEIQRAARFLYLLSYSFSALQSNFVCSNNANIRSLENLKAKILKLGQRLDRVMILNRDYEQVLEKYDGKDSFFYLDPPYFAYSKGLNKVYKEIEHEKLAGILKNIKGKFLLSYNNDDYIKNLYSNFEIIHLSKSHKFSNGGGVGRGYEELLIKNYK